MLFYANGFHSFLPGEMHLSPSAYPFSSGFAGREGKARVKTLPRLLSPGFTLAEWECNPVEGWTGCCGYSFWGINTSIWDGRAALGSKAQKGINEVLRKSFKNTRCFCQISK